MECVPFKWGVFVLFVEVRVSGAVLACPPTCPPALLCLPARCRPGAEQQPWVQSQTTFAVLHREDDGSWAVRTAKQKIWVEGISYELQVRGRGQEAGMGGHGVRVEGARWGHGGGNG